MLRDILEEVALTRYEIGKDALDERVMAAMAKVPRERFVGSYDRYRAFVNGPLPIGYGQTISQPKIVAMMTELLALRHDAKVQKAEFSPDGSYLVTFTTDNTVRIWDTVPVRERRRSSWGWSRTRWSLV